MRWTTPRACRRGPRTPWSECSPRHLVGWPRMPCERDLAESGRFRSEAPSTRRLECAEVWAGSERTDSVVEMPGLRAWVYSAPSGSEAHGGDVHYLSLCPVCTVSRIALADVSGHGLAVVALGEKLREL